MDVTEEEEGGRDRAAKTEKRRSGVWAVRDHPLDVAEEEEGGRDRPAKTEKRRSGVWAVRDYLDVAEEEGDRACAASVGSGSLGGGSATYTLTL